MLPTRERVKEDILKASSYSTINEDYFAQPEALTFAQMHGLLPYLRISTLTE